MPKKKWYKNWTVIGMILTIVAAIITTVVTFSFASGRLAQRVCACETEQENQYHRYERFEDEIRTYMRDSRNREVKIINDTSRLKALLELHMSLSGDNVTLDSSKEYYDEEKSISIEFNCVGTDDDLLYDGVWPNGWLEESTRLLSEREPKGRNHTSH